MSIPRDILIISSLGEPCTGWVCKELEKKGASFRVVNYEELVISHTLSVDMGTTLNSISFIIDGEHWDSRSIQKSIWMRRWGYPIYPADFDEYSISFSFNEISSIVSAIPDILEGAHWVNNPDRERAASNKINQLKVARSLGFKIPRTLVSNDVDRIRDFKNNIGRVIFKPVSATLSNYRNYNHAAAKYFNKHKTALDFGNIANNAHIFTQELTSEKALFLESIKWSPAIFQECLDKKYDIRVTVVGTKIFSCQIHSQDRQETEIDFRVMNLSGILPHNIVALPQNIERMVFDLMSRMGLVFGCIDLVETKTGDFYFLEINPHGQWLWIEQITGAKISEAVANELMFGSP